MTKDEILNLLPGIKADMLIAIQVFKRTPHPNKNKILGQAGRYVSPLHYSIAIMSAWEVVEWLQKNGYSFELTEHADPQGDFIMQVWRRDMEISDFIVRAVSAPLAICRAALLATINKDKDA